ncbi:putative ribonuclease H-like domain-containing protein [Tanacetum coccineum]
MEAGTTSITLITKLPILNPGEYDLWLMRIEQYFLMTDYSLWEVILNGNKVLKRKIGEVEQEYEPTTAEEKQDKRNEMKARGNMLMALPNKDQLKFHSYKDAKLLMEAIEKRYGGSSSETMDQTFDRLQKLISQLEIQGETISQEDMNLKLLRSLLSEWKTNALIWRNKVEIETISLDDFTNNNNNSINEADNTAYGVSTSHTQSSPTSGDNLSDAVIYAFLASQPNSPQMSREDLEQIDPDNLKEIDLQWEMTMLTIKARRFIKRTGRQLDVNGKRVRFDRSKVECYNCHKYGHFARECRLLRNQEKSEKENNRRTVTVETPNENALVAQDGIRGYDWSYQAEEDHPKNFALMAHTSSGSSSSSNSEVDSCSKSCVKAYATLKEQYDNLNSDYIKSQFNLVSYKAGLESVEARLAHYKENEAVFEDNINVLKLEVRLRDNALVENKKKSEKAKKERDELKLTLEKFQNSSKSLNNLLESQVSDKFKTRLGYNAATAACPVVESFVNSSDMLENQEYNRSKEYHAVLPPYTGNFIPRKPDLTFIDEKVESENMDITTVITPSDLEKDVSNHEFAGVKNNGDAVEPKTVRENSFIPLIIEDLNSNDKSEIDYTVRSSTEKIRFVKPARETVEKGNPQQKEYKEKRVIDSGCFRHMTRNKCYLTEYEDYDGGFVSFGDGKGRISGKGKIKTGKLYFDNVYFSKELKYNLFSVSEIYDKKNNVLFTDTECLVLSSDFKLLYECQVLMRVPRKDNIYSVDLKSVVPTKGKQHKASYKAKLVNSISKPLHMLHMDLFGLTNVKSLMKKSYCLVVTDDFSRFSWVFFLATKDETSEILKTFIIEIENQIDHKVKVIRCDNGTEFKNSVMNQFCEMKGIKREFSVARTPQQNGVSERKNRTLIEDTRTMLVDSKLPITFWAEVVNTACYVLNRVLVIKPHNKTPYELIRGRPPLIDFMKPFGCFVAILNNRDHLGKFDEKADEGYFVGYSVISKAMRVFNKRTKIVEETLNIRFLENTPNVKGNRQDWLFDVDSLSKSMNYVPVVEGNQTNGIAGTKDNIVGGPKDSKEDAGMKPTKVNESGASDKGEEDDQDTRSDTPVSTAGLSFANDAPSLPVNDARTSEEHLFKHFSPFKNAFTLPYVPNVFSIDDTGIFCNDYNDEDVGAEAGLNNFETTMNVSPIPTTRIDKDHPKD